MLGDFQMPSTPRTDPLAATFSTSYAGVVAFVAVATEGSFAKAGDRLGIGRSAVSRSVRKLEDQIAARLFVRTTRSTSLTQEGERFFHNCRPGIERISQAMEDMRDSRQGPPRGQLRIRAPSAFGRQIVMPLLSAFRSMYPDIAVELELDERHADFVSDRIDVAFREGRLEDSQIVAKQLIPMHLIVCASPAYARDHGLPADIEEICAHRSISYRLPSGRIAEWQFRIDGHARNLQPLSTCTFNDLDLVLQAVLEGQGIAQLRGFQVSGHLREGRLVSCLAHAAPDDGGHFLCYLSRHHLPARIRVFIDYMTDRIRALNQQYDADLPLSGSI